MHAELETTFLIKFPFSVTPYTQTVAATPAKAIQEITRIETQNVPLDENIHYWATKTTIIQKTRKEMSEFLAAPYITPHALQLLLRSMNMANPHSPSQALNE